MNRDLCHSRGAVSVNGQAKVFEDHLSSKLMSSPGMGQRSQPACQGCLKVPPDRVHRNGEVTSVRVAVSAAIPFGLGRRICAGRGSDSQSISPGTFAGAERAFRKVPDQTCPPSPPGRDRDSKPIPCNTAKRGAITKPPSVAPRCWSSRSSTGPISIREGRSDTTNAPPTRPLLRKRWQACLLTQPRLLSARPPVPRALAHGSPPCPTLSTARYSRRKNSVTAFGFVTGFGRRLCQPDAMAAPRT